MRRYITSFDIILFADLYNNLAAVGYSLARAFALIVIRFVVELLRRHCLNHIFFPLYGNNYNWPFVILQFEGDDALERERKSFFGARWREKPFTSVAGHLRLIGKVFFFFLSAFVVVGSEQWGFSLFFLCEIFL